MRKSSPGKLSTDFQTLVRSGENSGMVFFMDETTTPKRQHHPLVVTVLVMVALAVAVVPAAFGDASPGDVGNGNTINTSTQIPGKPGPSHRPSTPSASEKEYCVAPSGLIHECNEDSQTRGWVRLDDVVRKAFAQIVLPYNTPSFGPPLKQNKWRMIPVGYPIWLWVASDTTTVSHSVTQDGLHVSLTGRRLSIAFDMGDGNTTLCTKLTKRPAKLPDPMRKSPNCGYVYTKKGRYTLSATTTWLIEWQVVDQSGSFIVAFTETADNPIVIGELLTVITPG